MIPIVIIFQTVVGHLIHDAYSINISESTTTTKGSALEIHAVNLQCEDGIYLTV